VNGQRGERGALAPCTWMTATPNNYCVVFVITIWSVRSMKKVTVMYSNIKSDSIRQSHEQTGHILQ